MTRRLVVALAALSITTSSAGGQSRVRMRHDPPPRAAYHTLFQTISRVTDDRGHVVETADLGSMRWLAVQRVDGVPVWHLTYDSVRMRVREDGSEWREFIVLGVDSAWTQVRLDDRLRVLGLNEGPQLPGVTPMAPLLTGLPDLTLPSEAVSPGARWEVISVIPLNAPLTEGNKPITRMPVQAWVTVDSIIERSKDTLGYLTFGGRIRPTTIYTPDAGANQLELSGALAGTLVWSTSWSTFVSGATRMNLRVTREPTRASAAHQLRLERTTRYQVRP